MSKICSSTHTYIQYWRKSSGEGKRDDEEQVTGLNSFINKKLIILIINISL